MDVLKAFSLQTKNMSQYHVGIELSRRKDVEARDLLDVEFRRVMDVPYVSATSY